MSTTNYDDNAITGLIGEERIRKRPASMLGSSGIDGARHGFTEIYGNALDEISSGYGKKLEVRYYSNNAISVRDYGRGVPMGWNSNASIKNWNWHAIYNDLYKGGKLGYAENQEKLKKVTDWSKFNSKDYNYLYSVGLNGLGAAATQYTSEFFTVKSYRDGKVTMRDFVKGRPVVNGKPVNMFELTQEEIESIPEIIEDTNEPNGTFVYWKPDSEVFSDIENGVGGEWLYKTCKNIASVAGIELHFIDETRGIDETIKPGSIKQLAIDMAGSSAILDEAGNPEVYDFTNLKHGTIEVEKHPFLYVCECEVALVFTNSPVETICFNNSVKTSVGLQYQAVTDAISEFLRLRLKAYGYKFDKSDIDGVFGVVVSSYANYTSVRGQTKDGVDDVFIYTTIKEAITNKLNLELAKGDRAIMNMIARAIQKVQDRQAIASYTAAITQNKKILREKPPIKFVSCDAYEDKKYNEAELWITEGDSAKGAVKSARDKKFQAIYPIRGKGLNVLKASLEHILKNKEIREIFALLGTGMDISAKGKERTFDISKLKFDKIIFATDADEDGYQIRVLLFLTFYKLAPELITSGHVYIAETPRFRINFIDGTHVYAKNDAARDEIMKANSGRIKSISRYKGLGEVNADVLRETTIHPDTRNLIKLDCNLASKIERDLIDALYGADKLKQRKNVISDALNCDVSDILDDDALLVAEDNSSEEELFEEDEVV